MGEFLCNTDYSLLIIPQSSGMPSQNPTKIEIKSNKNLMLNKEALVLNITALFPAICNLIDHTHIFGNGVITATSKKVLCENQPPMRERDDGVCNGMFTHNKSGAVQKCSCKLILQNAGQSKVKGE